MNKRARIVPHGEVQASGSRNYYSEGRTISGARSFREVRIMDLYPGIDMRLYSDGKGGVEYDFIVFPGGDPSLIRMAVEGIEDMSLDKDGGIILHSALGNLRIPPAFSYQVKEGREVPTGHQFALEDNTIALRNTGDDSFDPDNILIIDPFVIDFSTFAGGPSRDRFYSMALGDDGSVAAAGVSESFTIPVTPGVVQATSHGNDEVFVMKVNTDGSIGYMTFLGGSADDWGFAGDIGPDGSVAVFGRTESVNFPVSSGAFQTSYGGNMDAFLAMLNSDGTLRWSTYIGGSGWEYADYTRENCRILDDNSCVLAFPVHSGNLPGSAGAAQPSYGGMNDLYITRFAQNGSLIYATYFGGTMDDELDKVMILDDGAVIIAGDSYSPDIPISLNPGTPYGQGALYFAWINSDGSLNWSTRVGGTGSEEITPYDHLTMLPDSSFVLGGATQSQDFPTTPGQDYSVVGAEQSIFISKYTKNGQRVWATTIGGSMGAWGGIHQVATDGSVIVHGGTRSTDFYVTPGAFQQTYGGGDSDGVLFKVDSNGVLQWSTYF
ncbi:MAG: hypothetical protein IH599_08170, partial [Bacteroidales bacterium]|nr:hypothetical protein [Bacteroidales bacterium]